MLASNGNNLTPAFIDDEQNRKSNMLHLSSIALFFGAITGIILFIIYDSFNLILVFSFLLIGAFLSLLLLRYRHIHFASWMLLLCLHVSLMFVLYLADGIHDLIILFFPTSILIASMLFDRRNLIAYSLIVFLSLQSFVVCELTGIIHNSMSDHTSILDMISVGIIMFISIALAYSMSESMKRSFLKINQSNNSLIESNQRLQDEMKERSIIEIALKSKVSELEQYKKMTVDRELKMVELKKEINRLNLQKGYVNEASQ